MTTISARDGVIALVFVLLFQTSQAAQAFGINPGRLAEAGCGRG